MDLVEFDAEFDVDFLVGEGVEGGVGAVFVSRAVRVVGLTAVRQTLTSRGGKP